MWTNKNYSDLIYRKIGSGAPDLKSVAAPPEMFPQVQRIYILHDRLQPRGQAIEAYLFQHFGTKLLTMPTGRSDKNGPNLLE